MTQLHLTGADVQNDKENFWTLLVEIYSAFSKYTLKEVKLLYSLIYKQYIKRIRFFSGFQNYINLCIFDLTKVFDLESKDVMKF